MKYPKTIDPTMIYTPYHIYMCMEYSTWFYPKDINKLFGVTVKYCGELYTLEIITYNKDSNIKFESLPERSDFICRLVGKDKTLILCKNHKFKKESIFRKPYIIKNKSDLWYYLKKGLSTLSNTDVINSNNPVLLK